MKQTLKSPNGTSFHQSTVKASINQLTEIMGEPETGGIEDKITHEWTMETDEGDVFTVYDWKEYRTIQPDEIIEWHIGGKSGYITMTAMDEIENQLKKQTT